MIEKVSILIDLPPDFPDKYRNAVVKAVDTCAVKAHILKPPVFEVLAEKREGWDRSRIYQKDGGN